jgi:hypothetical protein
MTRTDAARLAARLIQWGLRHQARPAQEPEYAELVERYYDDQAYRSLVREIAEGLGLRVLDVSKHGMVLSPLEGSTFALRPADFRPGRGDAETRLLDGLVQIAIATTVFPRARDLDDDPDLVRPPLTVAEVDGQLRQLAERARDATRDRPDPEVSDEERGLTEAWRVYVRRLDTMETRNARQSRRATRRVIEYALDRLRELGCFTLVEKGDEPAWQPTRRYQVLVQELAATRLFELVTRAVESSSSDRVPSEGHTLAPFPSTVHTPHRRVH